MNLVIWGCVIWMPALFYFILRNEARFKKNISLGVTMPQEAREDEEVLTILALFKKQLLIACVGVVICALPFIALSFGSSIGSSMTIWMIWIVFAVVVPYVPYVKHHLKLKAIKEKRGWIKSQSDVRVVAFSGIAGNYKWLSPYAFVIPLTIALIPLIFEKSMALVYLIDAAMILLCWFGYRYLYRNKAEMVDDNVEVTEALTRIRHRNWGKVWMLTAWFMAAINVFNMFFLKGAEILAVCGFLLLTAIFMVVVFRIEFATRRLQEKLTEQSGVEFYVDEDDKWIWGMFYYNPQDRRLIINNRTGINTTVNLAKPAGKIFMGLTVLLLLGMPFLGLWMDKLESTPVQLELRDEVVVAIHTGEEYEISIDDIAKVELCEDKPRINRTAGTGMENVQKGLFSTPWGSAKVCLNPKVAPYLHIETVDGRHYLFGSSDDEQTEAVYEQVKGLVD